MARPDINRSGELEVFVRVIEMATQCGADAALATPDRASRVVAVRWLRRFIGRS
ncbi:LysR family transcriptional regulator, partial [Stenotrophomonas maltophilia]